MQFYVPTRRDANTIAVYRRFNIKKSMDLFSDNGDDTICRMKGYGESTFQYYGIVGWEVIL